MPNANKTTYTACALTLLETELAAGLLARIPGFVLGEAASVPPVLTLGKGTACRGGHLGAAKPPALQPGRKRLETQGRREGALGWSQGKGSGEGIEKVPLIPDLQQLPPYLTVYKREHPASLPKTDIFCLLGCFAKGRADTDANLAGYLEGIWGVSFMKEYTIA